jgi:starch-binding outer membrane protein, SusD/RagB family
MKKYNIYHPVNFAVLLIAFSLSACKDYLTVAPENSLIKDKFWTKTDDVYSSLAATYNAFRDASLASHIWGELRADLVVFSGSATADYQKIAASDISPTNSKINWASYYKTINLANTLMYYDDEVFAKDKTFTQKMKDGVEAECLFLRSLSYFYLVRVWKEVPLVIQPSISDTANLYPEKSTEKEVINQIVKDLLVAKNLAYTTEYKTDGSPEWSFNGRANKYAIMALLADVYLWDEQYQNCINYCDSLTNTGLFALEDNTTWFNLYFPGNSPVEAIFELQFDDNLEGQENPIYYDLVKLPKGGEMRLNTKNVTTLLTKDDLRMMEANTPLWKWQGTDANTAVARSGNQRSANFIYYRYADVILMKAEAAIELGDFSTANALIREIAERAGTSYVDILDKEELREALRDEKGREFIVEGKRWFDLLRGAKRDNFANKQLIIDMILSGADIKQQAILRTKVYDTMSYYLPIQEKDIIYNQNLKQNPFYNR